MNARHRNAAVTRAIAIMGATATGKSALALALARELRGEVISMDSRQVYRRLDIGTGKVGAGERAAVPHHLIDLLDPHEAGSAGRHAVQAEAAILAIAARGRVPILAGGTGLYFRALFRGLVAVEIPRDALDAIRASFEGKSTGELYDELSERDPTRAGEISPRDRVRVTRALELLRHTRVPVSDLYAGSATRGEPDDSIRYLKLVLTMPRAILRERIAERTRALFEAGWVEEVRRLLSTGVTPRTPALSSLGYHEIVDWLASHDDLAACVDRVITATRQYAKRQETFFRSEKDAIWIDVTEDGAELEVRRRVAEFLERES